MTPLRIGDGMSFRKTLTVAEQAMYTGISGNMAPLYVDRRAAAEAALYGPQGTPPAAARAILQK